MKTVLILLSATAALAQQALYGQCAGLIWAGPYTCVAGTVCTYFNDYYSQCLPGVASSSSTSKASSSQSSSSSKMSSSTSSSKSSSMTTSSRSSSLTTSSKSSSLTSSSKSTSGTTTSRASSSVVVTTTTSGPSTTATLSSGYLWIRAVESPNYHSYLQTLPTGVPGTAILSSYTTAGQFQIVSGQLVQTTPSGLLYANVENPANITGFVKLGMSFSTTQNTFGSFAFSGDAVQWSAASVSRPNLSAWLVCENQNLYINLGSYAYMTPAGCVDETIHYYNDATANG